VPVLVGVIGPYREGVEHLEHSKGQADHNQQVGGALEVEAVDEDGDQPLGGLTGFPVAVRIIEDVELLQESSEELPVEESPHHRPEGHPGEHFGELAEYIRPHFGSQEANLEGLAATGVPGEKPRQQIKQQPKGHVSYHHAEEKGEGGGDHHGRVIAAVAGGVEEAVQQFKGLGPRGIFERYRNLVGFVMLVHRFEAIDDLIFKPPQGGLHPPFGILGNPAHQGKAVLARYHVRKRAQASHLVFSAGPQGL